MSAQFSPLTPRNVSTDTIQAGFGPNLAPGGVTECPGGGATGLPGARRVAYLGRPCCLSRANVLPISGTKMPFWPGIPGESPFAKRGFEETD